jgi:hypothetical protein
MLQFLDTNNVPQPKIYRMAGVGGVPTDPFPVRFECRDGYYFWATATAGVTVEARLEGDTLWTDITVTPIDVSPYAPDFSNFQVRLTPATDDEYEIHLWVGENP